MGRDNVHRWVTLLAPVQWWPGMCLSSSRREICWSQCCKTSTIWRRKCDGVGGDIHEPQNPSVRRQRKFDWSALSQRDCLTSGNSTSAADWTRSLVPGRQRKTSSCQGGDRLPAAAERSAHGLACIFTWLVTHWGCLGWTRVASSITSRPCRQPPATGSAISRRMASDPSTLFPTPDEQHAPTLSRMCEC